MTDCKSIVVLFHSNDHLEGYLVTHLAKYWRESGYRVEFVLGTQNVVRADLVLVHVNLSVVPQRYIDFANRYSIVLNGEVTDIRKRSFSQNLLRVGDDWDGPVIVKSNLNHGGKPERRLQTSWLTRKAPFLGRLGSAVDRLAVRTSPIADPSGYAVYRKLDDVPHQLLVDNRVVVEKFLAEVEHGLYHVRCYQFLGDCGVCHRVASREPIIRRNNCVQRQSIVPHPDIVESQKRLRIDYGKIDYVVHDGRAEIIDINKTTWGNAFQNDPEVDMSRRYRAAGIDAFFESVAQ